MKIIGPECFKLNIKNPNQYDLSPKGNILYSTKGKIYKLYIISYNNVPIYVGITRQRIKNRLNYGFRPLKNSGYYGYKWRHMPKKVDMYVWFHEDGINKNDIETIEAETVYEIRKQFNQWPESQTEIHFHKSSADHRKWAKKILNFFKLK